MKASSKNSNEVTNDPASLPVQPLRFRSATLCFDRSYKKYPREFLKMPERLKAAFKDKSSVAAVEVLGEIAAANFTSRDLQAPIDGHPNRVYHKAEVTFESCLIESGLIHQLLPDKAMAWSCVQSDPWLDCRHKASQPGLYKEHTP